MAAVFAEPALAPQGLMALHVGKFYPPFRGGMETHLQSLCENLRPRIDVQVIVANRERQSTEEWMNGIRVVRKGTLINLAAAQICPGMMTEIRRTKADLVHLHLPNPTAILAYLASGHQGRLVVSYHSDIVRQKVLGSIFQPILRRALDRCAAIIAATPNHIASSPVLANYVDRCHVIPYGIPIEPFDHRDQGVIARIRERYGPRMILSVGRLVYYKGFEFLIRAMMKVKANLVIIGEGPLRAQLEQEARNGGVADRVFFLGDLSNEEMIPFYQAADLFALASIARSEAFGIVQLEAMACGIPVVNTNLDSGVPFVSLDRVTGLTVPPSDSDALAAALQSLLDRPEQRREYGLAAARRVREEFTLEIMVRRTLQLYAQVMARRR
ncbi:MAG TPA: glycosyltransferase [Blastocatellia bacterium]|nr:glycosyltransferase [Blastocatellia bacterium]